MNYPYANGTIKALETKVLDKNKLFVLVKYDKNEFVRVLQAMNYGENDSTIEDLIASEMLKVKKTIDEITPDKDNTDLFYLVNDSQNIKVLYKIKHFNITSIDKKSLLQENGSINSDILVKAILDENYEYLSKKQTRLLQQLNETTKDMTNPKLLSALVDDTIYTYALKTSNTIIKRFITAKIDFTNVISILRSKHLSWDYSEFSTMFINGGIIPYEVFNNIYKLNNEEFIKTLEPYYEEKISWILNNYLNDFAHLESSFDELMLNIMSEYKDDPLTIGPMVYYYLLKQAESQNIRLLYSKNNITLTDLI